MKDLWRIPFTILFLVICTLGFFTIGVFGIVFCYLFTGLIINLLCPELPIFAKLKVLLLWFPALWIDNMV